MFETAQTVGVVAYVFRQQLERNTASQNRVFGKIDFAHSAFADFGGNTVMGDGPLLWSVFRAGHFQSATPVRVRPSRVHASVSGMR